MKLTTKIAVAVMILAQFAIAILSYRDDPRQAAIGFLLGVVNCLIFGVI